MFCAHDVSFVCRILCFETLAWKCFILNSMVQMPDRGARSCLDGERISYLLCYLKFLYYAHKSQLLDPILSYLNPVCTFISCSFNSHLCIIIASRSPKLPFSGIVTDVLCVSLLLHVLWSLCETVLRTCSSEFKNRSVVS